MEELELLKIVEKCETEYDAAEKQLPFGLSWDEYNEALYPFRKKISEASRNYRKVKTPKFIRGVPEYGDVMPLDEFIDCVKSGGFIDYDGYGHYIIDDKETDITIYPSDVKHNAVRDDFKKIVWYNR
jgi:hypothetical protein